MKKKNLAFTLAEVLIVIGIIGVVAALTLPNLNHATGDKERITKVKKIYSALTDALDRAQVIYGDFDTWFDDEICRKESAARSQKFAKRVTEFMKVSKDCGINAGCFAESSLYSISNNNLGNNYLNNLQSLGAYMVVLSDGISLAFDASDTIRQRIRVDIDGPNKGKNQVGNDIFDFSIFTDEYSFGQKLNQLYPSSQPESWNGILNNPGAYTTAWIIENDNADYLKADSTGKCNDSDIVLDWTTNTSCH